MRFLEQHLNSSRSFANSIEKEKTGTYKYEKRKCKK